MSGSTTLGRALRPAPGMLLGTASIAKVPPHRDRLTAMLSPAERDRAGDEAGEAARDRFLLGRLLLRELASHAAGVTPEEVAIEARCRRCGAEHGAPRASIAGHDFPASLTSSGGTVVAAVAAAPASAGGPARLGIDLELTSGETSRLRGIESLLAGRPPARPHGEAAILRRWTRVEAVLKADGRGLRLDPALVRIEGIGGRRLGRIEGHGESARYLVLDRRVAADGILSIAVATRR